MPMNPAAAAEIAEVADAVSKTSLGKRLLKGTGVLLGGVGTGVALMGQVLGGAEAQADAQMQSLGQVLAAVSRQYEAEAEAIRLELAQTEIELAICEERGTP